MIDTLISWIWANPLPSVAIMTAVGVVTAVMALRPELAELLHRNHPRC